MIPKRPIKALELVVLAIQSLSKRKGWPIQKIVKHLGKRYSLNVEKVRLFVREGLRQGLATGILTQHSGLFQLNHAVIDTWKKKINAYRKRVRRLKAQEKIRNLKRNEMLSHRNSKMQKNHRRMEMSISQQRKSQEGSQQSRKTK